MDTCLKYQSLIKNVLQNQAEYRATIPDGYTCQLVFDDERGQYLVLDMGWNGDKYLHATPIHLSLIEGKVWIHYDDTEDGIATDLMAAGVSQEDIVLGFRHPKIRQHTGFAVA
ncbi:MAG: XisI protein [Leptolyngbyaceae cyanobacterium SU_3_3]|nr:XisI protein [Leptolyngbyaceae cyanobacterium SU_3_3]NJL41235.1 XisI protein [Leptolyngbyaceae cyanobacterium SM1_4_3]